MIRRALTAGLALGFGASMAGATIAYRARYVNPYAPRLERATLPVPPGHEGLAEMRIGFVTDTHVGPFITAADIARACAMLTSEEPDLILLGGDYISESPRYIHDVAPILGALIKAAPLGGYAVLGTHDLSVSQEKVARALAGAGIPVLRNQAAAVHTNRGTIWIAGIDETLIGTPDVAGTFAQIPPGAAVLALWHEPEFAEECAAHGAFAQLSGHSHGGQVRLPFLGPVGLPSDGRRHVIGLSDANGMPVYTSRGVGVYRPPARLNCPPEVTLVTLAAPAGSSRRSLADRRPRRSAVDTARP
jgi:predicted MPP superfamily phosphohydrolase